MPHSHHAAPGGASTRSPWQSLKWGAAWLALSSPLLLLSGCGGGGDSSVSLGINAIVGGQPLATVFAPGSVGTIDMTAGQSIELDANEPVEWTFSIAGGPLFGNGTTVFYNGLAITETAVSPSRVVLDTAVTGAYGSPVVISMTATSTIDATEVAAVDVVVH